MPTAIICSNADVEAELGHTVLWRTGMQRHLVHRAEEARALATSNRAELVVIDRDLAGADQLVAGLRQEPATRKTSVVIMAAGDFEAAEVDLLEAGANAILRLPAGPEWDERLMRLLEVPVRREARFSVFFKVEGSSEEDGAPVVGTALNLSVSGMLLETPSAVHMNSEVHLQFRLPELDDLIKVSARVVRTAGNRRFGMEFLDLSAPNLEAIQRFVALDSGPGLPSAGW